LPRDGVLRVTAGPFDGRVALVTGGASGLGLAAAGRLAHLGARVAVVDRADSACDLSVRVDVTEPAAMEAAVRLVERELAPIDILIHAAGVGGAWGSAFALSVDEWRRIVDINLTGSYIACRTVIPGMVRRGYGRVVLLSSVAGKEGHPSLAAYASAKAGVIALAKSLGREVAGTGVLVNAITPAAFATPMATEQAPEVIERMIAAVPLGRLGEPEEAAAMIAWLAGEECSFSTGAVFDLSGGRSVW
jgi:2-dehydro-3-deoxy-L-rhamnonate dehydrogenase (NAD+)